MDTTRKTSIIFKLEWQKVKLTCKYISGKTNPYRLYITKWYYDEGKEWPTKHTKQIAAYGDLTSIMYYTYGLIRYVEYGYHTGQGEAAVYDSILKA